jgi:hypothetical protein
LPKLGLIAKEEWPHVASRINAGNWVDCGYTDSHLVLLEPIRDQPVVVDI